MSSSRWFRFHAEIDVVQTTSDEKHFAVRQKKKPGNRLVEQANRGTNQSTTLPGIPYTACKRCMHGVDRTTNRPNDRPRQPVGPDVGYTYMSVVCRLPYTRVLHYRACVRACRVLGDATNYTWRSAERVTLPKRDTAGPIPIRLPTDRPTG
jgi:hypothetical protein